LNRPLARWLSLPLQAKSRTIEAAATLLQVRLIFALLPFAQALRFLRIEKSPAACGRVAAAEAAEIGLAISRITRHVPFRVVCLQQAFAALLMLRRRGVTATVHMGAKRDLNYKHLKAHAWCCSGAVPVTGFPTAYEFTAVATFSALTVVDRGAR
jgi:hypothetical protein